MRNLPRWATPSRGKFRIRGLTLIITCLGGCAPPAQPSPPPPVSPVIDVVPFLVGDRETWPRYGSQWQDQIVDLTRRQVCWAKYGNSRMFECWRWDDEWVYHVIDHGLDGGRGGAYRFTDGRWLPRYLPTSGWSLDLTGNRIRRFDAACTETAGVDPFPYRVRAWFEPGVDIGGDLGVRDVVVLEYGVHPVDATVGLTERFYLARGAGWYLWTRSDGVRVVFARRGGPVVSEIETRCVW
jgi:hypothetical protein